MKLMSIENSSPEPVSFAITTYITGPVPDKMFTLRGGQILDVGINSIGSQPQYIWILDPETGRKLGKPENLLSISNSAVLRNGINKWYVQFYNRAVLKG